MIQTPAFRNINIFFLIQTYGSYIYTVQKIILRPAGPRFITAMTGGGRWLQEGTQGEERGGQRGTPLLFFSPFSRGRLDIHTSCGRSRRSVHCFRYRPFHSAPNTRPLVLSFCRIFTGSSPCTRTYNQLHPLLSLPLTLSHSRTFSHFSLAHFFVCFYALLFRYFFFLLFFSPFLVIYTRARVHVCRVLIFSNI